MKKLFSLLLVLLALCSLALAESVPAEVIVLGLTQVDFRMQLIDATQDEAVPAPVTYLDIAYESRLEDKSVQSHFNHLFDLMALTKLQAEDGSFAGLKAISYESTPITEYPDRLNSNAIQWKVFINGALKTVADTVQEGDLVQIVYTAADTAPEASDDKLANKYFFKKNDTVCYDFTMSLHADEATTLAQGSYKLYVPAVKVPDMMLADLIAAVCQQAGLEFYNDGMSISIGDYISEQDSAGNYHYWYLRDDATGYGSSLGLSGDWGVKVGAGTHYSIWFR